MIHDMIFTQEWLDSKAENDPQGRTNRQIQFEVCTMLRVQRQNF